MQSAHRGFYVERAAVLGLESRFYRAGGRAFSVTRMRPCRGDVGINYDPIFVDHGFGTETSRKRQRPPPPVLRRREGLH
jgi:hypothetical protein